MKLTKSKLKQVIEKELGAFLKENLGGYFGGVKPAPTKPKGPLGKVTVGPRPGLDQKVAELIGHIGEEEFFDRLLDMTSNDDLHKLIQTIAREKELTLGGVKYLEET